MNLKKQLKLYLENKGLTASELSRLSGVPKQSISDWLGGSNPRDIRSVKKVAEALAVTLDHLVFGEGVEEGVSRNAIPSLGENSFQHDGWMRGVYEVKFRRVKE